MWGQRWGHRTWIFPFQIWDSESCTYRKAHTGGHTLSTFAPSSDPSVLTTVPPTDRAVAVSRLKLVGSSPFRQLYREPSPFVQTRREVTVLWELESGFVSRLSSERNAGNLRGRHSARWRCGRTAPCWPVRISAQHCVCSLQTILMDQSRFQELQLQLEQLAVLGAVLLVTFSTAAPGLSDQADFAEKLKMTVKILLTDMHLP